MFIPARPLHNETQRHVARMSVRNDDHIEHMDLLIRGLHDERLWDKIDIICVAGPNKADSLLDLKGTQDSSELATMTFTADQGFSCVAGTNQKINTGFTFSSPHGSNNHIACYFRNSAAGTTQFFMGETYSAPGAVTPVVYLWDLASTIVVGASQAPGLSIASTGAGFRASSRIDANNVTVSSDGATASGSIAADAWDGGTHYPLYVGGRNALGTPDTGVTQQFAFWSVGTRLSSLELMAYRLLVHEYFTRRGTAV